MSNCSCIYSEGDGEYCTNFIMRTPVARKEHICNECGCKIKPGNKYFHERLVYNGDFDTQRTCIDCMSCRKVFFCTYSYGTLWEEMEYHIECEDGQISSESILACTLVARNKIIDLIDQLWEK